jgi:hypothetical protein
VKKNIKIERKVKKYRENYTIKLNASAYYKKNKNNMLYPRLLLIRKTVKSIRIET